jgi:hypothetical protein
MWDVEWRAVAQRLDSWCATADAFLRHRASLGQVAPLLSEAVDVLSSEADEILRRMDALNLPPALRDKINHVERRLDRLMTSIRNKAPGNERVSFRWIALVALRTPLDEDLATTEEPRRRLVERAFLHLNRTLTVDRRVVRVRWNEAFDEGETECEKLGALHLLSHGIYAFKADAGSGRTDLILGEPLSVNEDVLSTAALVLTEWKLVRDDDDPVFKAREGKTQAERYANVELAGIELRSHRYVVLVSRRSITAQIPRMELDQGITTHYVNIVVHPLSPSDHSRRAASSTSAASATRRAPRPRT